MPLYLCPEELVDDGDATGITHDTCVSSIFIKSPCGTPHSILDRVDCISNSCLKSEEEKKNEDFFGQ